MKTRGHVILFSARFAAAVEAGAKAQTIRPVRKRKIAAGDRLDLRAWIGLPYRTKQRRLRVATCAAVKPFSLSIQREHAFVRVGQEWLHEEPAQALARRDGFKDVIEMVEWFEAAHGLPFKGVLIEWTP